MIGAGNAVKWSSQGGKTGDAGGELSCRAHSQGAKTAGKRQVNEWVEVDMDPDGPRRFGSAK